MLALTEEPIEIVRTCAQPIPPPARSRFYELVDRKQFLQKPFGMTELTEKIRLLVDRA